MKPLKLYCVVQTKKPKLSYWELYRDKDIKLKKGEKIIPVEVIAKK